MATGEKKYAEINVSERNHMHHDMSSWHLFQHPLVPMMAVFKHRFPAQVLSHCQGILVFHRFKVFFKPADRLGLSSESERSELRGCGRGRVRKGTF